jgi:hypothetical protein
MAASLLDSWSLGVERFIATLPPEHRATFKAPANSDECMQLIEKAQLRNRKFDRLARIIQPLVDPLRRFEGSIDILIQTNSTFASPVWGPLKAVLTIVSDRLSTLQNLALLLERLVDPLKRFQNYELLFKESSQLQNAIGTLYFDLLDLCTRIVAHFCKTGLRKAFSSFDKDLEDISDNIRHHWNEVDIAANAANIEEAKAARQAQEAQRLWDIRRDINRWICPSNVEDELFRRQSEYMPGSCDWIVSDPEFQSLLRSDCQYSLKVQGRPGSGKSIAASFMVQYLQETTKNTVLYFSCDNSDGEKRLSSQILRTLLWQLLQHDTSLYDLLAPWYHRSGRPYADSDVQISAMFKEAVAATKLSPLFLIVDGLDECEDPSELLRTTEAVRITSCALKMIFLAREDPSLNKPLAFCNAVLSMDSNHQPLDDYVCERLAKMRIFTSIEIRTTTADAISKASDGLWLFSRLLLDEIEHAPSFGEVNRKINSVPSGMIQLYSSIITAKAIRQTDLQIKMAQQLYLWVDTSEYVPEWLWKETSGDNLEDDMIGNLLQFACSSHEIFNPFKVVQELCAPLIQASVLHPITICRPEDPYDYTIFNVKFFHQTAKHYLKWCTEAPLGQLPTSLQAKRLGHLHRGITAAWYFSESLDFKVSLKHLRDRPRSGRFACYFEMVCGLWGCLKLKKLRRDLAPEETRGAEDMCNAMVWFLGTDKCIGFVEASIILHFSERSTMLLDNIEEALNNARSQDYQEVAMAFSKFREARQIFLSDLAYIIVTVWPKDDLPEYWKSKYGGLPEGFHDRSLTKRLLHLAESYAWLLWKSRASSINCFAFSGNGKAVEPIKPSIVGALESRSSVSAPR